MRQKIIKKTKEYTITKHTYKDMPFCNFVQVTTDMLSFSINLSCIAFQVIKDKETMNQVDLQKIPDKDISDYMISLLPSYKNKFKEGIEQDSPMIATIYHDKKDGVCQFYKIWENNFDNKLFSDKAMYKYAKLLYHRLDDVYAYEVLEAPLSYYRNRNKDEISLQIRNELKDKIKDDKIKVYRGFNQKSRKDGISYTTDIEVAKFFANRFQSMYRELGYVNEYEVHIDDIIAFIDEGESEIVTDKAVLIKVMI